jgi:hypothetical protein
VYCRYSSAAASNWINMAFDSTPPNQLRFGDFNGDGVTDVFTLKQHCTINLPLVALRRAGASGLGGLLMAISA